MTTRFAFVGRLRRLAAARALGRTARSADAGMTLLEIMIVLALIGLVMGSIGFGLNAYFKKGQAKTAKIAVQQVAQACAQYMMENNNTCPAGMQDLVANRNLPRPIKDPWGKEMQIKCPGASGDTADVFSSGPDKQEGTADDIKSEEQ